MVSTYNDDFSVTWADPADAELTWLYDPMHMPYPLCPAVTELWDGVYQRYMSARTVYVNGYGYATQPTPGSSDAGDRETRCLRRLDERLPSADPNVLR